MSLAPDLDEKGDILIDEYEYLTEPAKGLFKVYCFLYFLCLKYYIYYLFVCGNIIGY